MTHFGPPQFRINRGTSLKWINLLSSTQWICDPAQLSYIIDDVIYGSAEGLLASIAEPEPKLAWDGVTHLYDNSQFSISLSMAKSLKLKGFIPEYSSFEQALVHIQWSIDQFIPE